MRRCANATGAGMTALHLLMERLANPLNQQAGKWLVIPQSAGYAITSDLARVSNVPARGRPMGSSLPCSDPFALPEVQP